MMVTLTKEYCSRRRFDQALTVMRQLPLPLQPTEEEKLKLQQFYKCSIQNNSNNNINSFNDILSNVTEDKESDTITIHLSPSQAQEEYYKAVIQLLKRYSDRPFIFDIIESLERGKRISEIKLPASRSLPLSNQSSASQEDYFSCGEDNDTSPDLNHLNLPLSNNSWKDNSIPIIKTPSNNSLDDTPMDPLSSDELDYSSDDGATMSTCTVRANPYLMLDNQLDRNLIYNNTRLLPEAEIALETLQTQVASLNEKLELLQRDIQLNYSNSNSQKQVGFKEIAIKIVKKSIIHLISMALIFIHSYRCRTFNYRLLLIQLLIPFFSILKYLFKSMRKLIK